MITWMSEAERLEYAQAQREACRPMECTLDEHCWVTIGGKDALQAISMTKTPRCNACAGKLLLEEWKTPRGLKLPPNGRLLTRSRSRGPVSTDYRT